MNESTNASTFSLQGQTKSVSGQPFSKTDSKHLAKEVPGCSVPPVYHQHIELEHKRATQEFTTTSC